MDVNGMLKIGDIYMHIPINSQLINKSKIKNRQPFYGYKPKNLGV